MVKMKVLGKFTLFSVCTKCVISTLKLRAVRNSVMNFISVTQQNCFPCVQDNGSYSWVVDSPSSVSVNGTVSGTEVVDQAAL